MPGLGRCNTVGEAVSSKPRSEGEKAYESTSLQRIRIHSYRNATIGSTRAALRAGR